MQLSSVIAAWVKLLTRPPASTTDEGGQSADLSDQELERLANYVRRGGLREWCATSFGLGPKPPAAPSLSEPLHSIGTVLAEFGENPVTGRAIRIVVGRFGAYITDGEWNATVPPGHRGQSLTLDDAIELLQHRKRERRLVRPRHPRIGNDPA